MRVLYVSLALASVAVASGCSREPADANALQAPGSAVASTPATTAAPEMKIIERAPAQTAAASTTRRSTSTTTRRSAPRTSEPEVYRPVETVYAPQPTIVTEKQVKRDAIIGAGVGAVAGAVLNSDNRVKGGIVGAVLGGAAGAAVGATIDKKTRVVYPQP
jgi:hypothetical protein